MTVNQLIEKLKKFDGNQEVIYRSYDTEWNYEIRNVYEGYMDGNLYLYDPDIYQLYHKEQEEEARANPNDAPNLLPLVVYMYGE